MPDSRPSHSLKNALKPVLAIAAAALVMYSSFHLTEMSGLPDKLVGTVADEAASGCRQSRPSALATRYLENLHGIEIGASTQNSFGLKRAINVDFSDEQGGLWQSADCAPAVVNIVALGDDLPFKDGTLDYVLSSHVIEHFFDPVKALREWHRVIKPGGYIFIIAPHKDRTFDRSREVTPVAELMDRAAGKIRISDYARPDSVPDARAGRTMSEQQAERPVQLLVRDKHNFKLEKGWKYYETDDHHHWSVWRTADFVELVKHLNFRIVEIQDVDDKVGNGFTVVIQKEK